MSVVRGQAFKLDKPQHINQCHSGQSDDPYSPIAYIQMLIYSHDYTV